MIFGTCSPRIKLLITIGVVVILIWQSRRKRAVPGLPGAESTSSPDSEKKYLFHNDDLLLGATIAGILAFFAGFYLPMRLTPGANQGPLTGFIVAPVAAVAGALLADRIAHAHTSHLKWFLVACLLGFISTPLLFIWEARKPEQNSGYTYGACALLIFGLTGAAVQLRHLPKK